MKIRTGFISNSSSSNFIVFKRFLSQDQIDKILNHIEYAKENFPQIDCAESGQSWRINETEEQIMMFTYMDNFDMYDFLIAIGVADKNIQHEKY